MKRKCGWRWIGYAATTGFIVLSFPSFGEFARTWTPVPYIRIVKNLTESIKSHPSDASLHYALGRIHSIAFATGKSTLDLTTKDRQTGKAILPPSFTPYSSVMVSPESDRKIERKRAIELLRKSLDEYHAALRLTPDNALYRLGYAWMLEQAFAYAPEMGKLPYNSSATPSANDWKRIALGEYRKAYKMARDQDLKNKHGMMEPDGYISVEAAQNIIRLIQKSTTRSEQDEISEMKSTIKNIMDGPHLVTPIIFALSKDLSLKQITDPKHHVEFDLAVLGRRDSWQWVKPSAGILVWDPLRTGKVHNGAQLFGNRTWQMFFKNGYEALALLDDNHDGQLTGRELNGISVWCDKNGNGRSDRGEVVPITSLGVTAICVQSSGLSEGVPSSKQGISYADGSSRYTYDWTPTGNAGSSTSGFRNHPFANNAQPKFKRTGN